jgi:O-acetyl-ADP-ribose deacetylase (regulator of RNase III)
VRLEFVRGDITEQEVDAIVNAANSSLLGGGGVDGAIHRRGGPAILAECRELRAGRLRTGLPTVGPVHAKREDRSELLASAYRESLRVADELGATSVAFPAVSAGVYGWPAGDAARIGVQTVLSTPSRVELVRFVLFSDPMLAEFEQAARDAGGQGERRSTL